MTDRKSRFVNIDELQSQVDLETACQFYGVDPGELQRIGKDIRTKCFLNCGKSEETGNRAIAIDAERDDEGGREAPIGAGTSRGVS